MIIDHSQTAPRTSGARAGRVDNRPSDARLEQYYTRPDVAEHFYAIFRKHCDPGAFLLVEPSAGTGSFFKLFPTDSVAFDVEPKYAGIRMADFLKIKIQSDWPVAVLGNPPFGRNSSMAVRFFNHAASLSIVIALILPRTFRKASIINRLDTAFHLLREEEVPADAFLFRSKPYDVSAVFQIWVRRAQPRPLQRVETEHPDFDFIAPQVYGFATPKAAEVAMSQAADFVIQRVGARAGRVHHDFSASPNSHYFIRAIRKDVEAIMARLDFASVAGNTAGNPSLSKAEIISLYREWTDASALMHPL